MADSDFRIECGWRRHWKRGLLKRLFGADGVLAIEDLWSFAAENKPTGDLSGMSDVQICAACGWDGDPKAFVAALASADLHMLDSNPGGYSLHDWADHQPYIVTAPSRQAQAQKAAAARWNPRDENARSMLAACSQHARGNAHSQTSNAPTYLPTYLPTDPTDHSPEDRTWTANAVLVSSKQNEQSATLGGEAPGKHPRSTREAPEPPFPEYPNRIDPQPGECARIIPAECPGHDAVKSPVARKKPDPGHVVWDNDAERFTGITEADWQTLREAAPSIDVRAKVRQLEVWYAANPSRRKKRPLAWLVARCADDHNRASMRSGPSAGASYGDRRNVAETAWSRVIAVINGLDINHDGDAYLAGVSVLEDDPPTLTALQQFGATALESVDYLREAGVFDRGRHKTTFVSAHVAAQATQTEADGGEPNGGN